MLTKAEIFHVQHIKNKQDKYSVEIENSTTSSEKLCEVKNPSKFCFSILG